VPFDNQEKVNDPNTPESDKVLSENRNMT